MTCWDVEEIMTGRYVRNRVEDMPEEGHTDRFFQALAYFHHQLVEERTRLWEENRKLKEDIEHLKATLRIMRGCNG